jgi:hypothetical protein
MPSTVFSAAKRTLRKDAAKEDNAAGREAMLRLANLRFYDLRQHADSPIMPTVCGRHLPGGARVVLEVGIIRGIPGRPEVCHQVGSVRA